MKVQEKVGKRWQRIITGVRKGAVIGLKGLPSLKYHFRRHREEGSSRTKREEGLGN